VCAKNKMIAGAGAAAAVVVEARKNTCRVWLLLRPLVFVFPACDVKPAPIGRGCGSSRAGSGDAGVYISSACLDSGERASCVLNGIVDGREDGSGDLRPKAGGTTEMGERDTPRRFVPLEVQHLVGSLTQCPLQRCGLRRR
jgi:hypothetical protein